MPPPRWHRDSASSYKFRSSSAVRKSSPLSFGEANAQGDEMDVPGAVVDAPNGTALDQGYEPTGQINGDTQDTPPRTDYPGLTDTPASEVPADPMLVANSEGILPEYYDEQQPSDAPAQADEEEAMGEIPIDPAMIDPALMAGTASQRVSEPRSTSEEPTGTIEVHDPSLQVIRDDSMQDVEQTDFPAPADTADVKAESGVEHEDNANSEQLVNGAAGDSSYPQRGSGDTSLDGPSNGAPTTELTQHSGSSPAEQNSASKRRRSSPLETRAKSAEVKAEAKASDSTSNSVSGSQSQDQEKGQEHVPKTSKLATSSEITTRSSTHKGSSSPEMTRTTRRSKAAQEQAELAAHVRQKLSEKPTVSTPLKKEQAERGTPEPAKKLSRSQPTPAGQWAYLTPYVDGEYSIYPEMKVRSDDEANGDDQSPEDKEEKEPNDMEPMVEDNDDTGDAQATEVPTPALNTPRRGSPVPDSGAITAFGSPAPAVADEGDDDSVSDTEEPQRSRHFRFRKIRDAEEYISALENFEDMSTADLYAVLEAINVSMVQWQTEWTSLGKRVDDYENAQRRRAADAKYESRTRNLHQHNFNYEEPDFAVKGYKAKEKETMSETRYLQGQDRIMAATYGFEYDPHPSKIGRQNPELQQEGMVTRGRMLRNHPRQTVKASEGDEPTGKRQRKPVQLFDPAPQDVSRSSTPVPTRARRRKNAAAEPEELQPAPASSVNDNAASDDETGVRKTRRRRGRAKADPDVEEPAATVNPMTSSQEEPTRSVRRGRGRPGPRYDDMYASPSGHEKISQSEEKDEPRRHLLTLKIPKGKHFDDAASAMTDNGDSRPSTAGSESSSHTVESSYSFRPKRQKRFRDEPEESPTAVSQQPPKKRRNRTSGAVVVASKDNVATPAANNSEKHSMDGSVAAMPTTDPFVTETPQTAGKKLQKIKVVRAVPQNESSRYGTPTTLMSFNSEDGDEPPKDYKSMTKSEKMSASMKSRWANGNMAGAVEKRKATLAAKKAAQAAAEARVGAIAPKPQAKRSKKDAMEQQRQQQQHHPPQHQHPHLQPQLHHHHHHHHQQPPHMQHMQPIQPHHHQPLQPHPPPPHHHPQQPPPPPPPPHHEGQGRFQGFPSRFHAFIANPWGPPGPPPQM